jgi:CheY-like chemotaxis protein
MRIVIAEDSAVIRAGLVEILADRGHETVAAVGDAEALRAAVDEHKPDAAVVDVRMPPHYTDEGIRAAIAIRRATPPTCLGRHPAAVPPASDTCSRTASAMLGSSSTR